MSNSIRVADPLREYQVMGKALNEAILGVAESGRYVAGPEHDAFEMEFGDYVGARFAVGTGNASDSLEIVLSALGCAPGDRVITTANSGGFSVTATRRVGADPVFADVLPECLMIDPAALPTLITAETTAVVVTHLFGQIHPRIEEIVRICDRHGVAVIEDCAQSAGAWLSNRHAGAFGTAAVHSFYPTKNLGALGDGGMITTDDPRLADTVRSLRLQEPPSVRAVEVGGARNSRLDEIQAAVLRVKLRHLDELCAQRRAIVESYRSSCSEMWWSGTDDPSYSAHLAVTRVRHRDRFRRLAADAGIETAVHFPMSRTHSGPGHPNTCTLAHTAEACGQIVSIPCHPFMTQHEITRVTDFLRSQDRNS